jgi:hypothetical protein
VTVCSCVKMGQVTERGDSLQKVRFLLETYVCGYWGLASVGKQLHEQMLVNSTGQEHNADNHHLVIQSPLLEPVPNQFNLVHTHTVYSFKIQFNITLLPTPESSYRLATILMSELRLQAEAPRPDRLLGAPSHLSHGYTSDRHLVPRL